MYYSMISIWTQAGPRFYKFSVFPFNFPFSRFPRLPFPRFHASRGSRVPRSPFPALPISPVSRVSCFVFHSISHTPRFAFPRSFHALRSHVMHFLFISLRSHVLRFALLRFAFRVCAFCVFALSRFAFLCFRVSGVHNQF